MKKTKSCLYGLVVLSFSGFFASASQAADPGVDPNIQTLQKCVVAVAQSGGVAALQAMSPWSNVASANQSCLSAYYKLNPSAAPSSSGSGQANPAGSTSGGTKTVDVLLNELIAVVQQEVQQNCRSRNPEVAQQCQSAIEEKYKIPAMPVCTKFDASRPMPPMGPHIYCPTVEPALRKCRYLKPISEKDFASCMAAAYTEPKPPVCNPFTKQYCNAYNAKLEPCKGLKGPDLEKCLGPN